VPSAPPDADVRRFRGDLEAVARGHKHARVGLCVSGGPDSLALLLLAHAALDDVAAATVDHGLREAAAVEAYHVGALCAALNVPHTVLTLETPEPGNISAWARRERYAALLAWAQSQEIDVLLTAHHADDQLETMIMRLNRGSGVAGLAGIRAQNDGLLRPLLGWRKAELESVVAACGVEAVDDPSNRDDRFDRARLRKELALADWLDPVAASHSAAALAEAEFALDWAAKAYSGRRVAEQNGVISFDPRALPRELLRRIVLICLRRVEPGAAPRGDEMDRLIAGLSDGRTATLAGVKCISGDFWLFTKAPPRRKN
jgi:tRNA(Ile)-lysidine synthase